MARVKEIIITWQSQTIAYFFFNILRFIYNMAKSNEIIPELRIYKFDVTLLLLHSEVYEQIYTEMQTNQQLKFINI